MDRHQVIGFSSRFGKPPLQKLVKRFQVLQPPVLPRPYFAQIATELDKAGIFLRLFALLPSQDLIDLGEHEPSTLAVQLGRKRRMFSNYAQQANQDFVLLSTAPKRLPPTPNDRRSV